MFYNKLIVIDQLISFLDPPGSVSITPDKNTFYTKYGGKPYEDVVCRADCLPSCTYVWFYASFPGSRKYEHTFTSGNSLFAAKTFYDRSYRYFFCQASNSLGSSDSKWIMLNVKGKFN